MTSFDADAVAGEVLRALDAGRPVAPFTQRDFAFGVDAAYAVTARLRALRLQRGERQVGRKIGFTNRNIWTQYRVDRPIWGDVYDSTLHRLAASDTFALARLCEPQIEPEIVFGLRAAPSPGMDESALAACIDWIAHGFEIVHSIFPGWKFGAADTIAAGGLHGALLLGTPCAIASIGDPVHRLAEFTIVLSCDGEIIDTGSGSNVLGSPLSALRHLVELLQRDPLNPPLRAGEIVTTGTLTRAFPVAAGQTWQTAISGIALPHAAVTFG